MGGAIRRGSKADFQSLGRGYELRGEANAGAEKKNGKGLTYEDLYYVLVGEIGLSPAEFWRLTEGETAAKLRGWHFAKAYEADNFRALYTLTYNVNAKKGHQKQKEQLWKLIIDTKEGPELSHEEIVERNRKIREALQ